MLLLVLTIWLVSTERVQNYLVKKATTYLSEKLHTKVEVGHVKLSFFNQFHVQHVYIEDDKKDTLAYVGDLGLKTSELLSNYWNGETMVIRSVSLQDAFIHLNRTKDTSRWNYDFIAEAFASNTTTDTTIQTEPEKEKNNDFNPKLDLKTLYLQNIRFYMDDAWRGEDMRFNIANFETSVKHLQFIKKDFEIEKINIDGVSALVREYDGGKPEDLTPDDTTDWGTPFNPGLVSVVLDQINVSNSQFQYEVEGSVPEKGLFDERHLQISDLNLNLKHAIINADTLTADIQQLTANERCGLKLKSVQAKLKLSQVLAEMSDLNLQTEYSNVGNYYAMTYSNFHDFNDFINKVVLHASLHNSSVSSLDIAYFAPLLNEYPIAIQVAGEVNGLVRNLATTNLNLSTSNSSFKGNGTIVGLPDIEQTVFDYTIDQLKTTGTDLNRLIPQTKTDAVAWQKLNNIDFKGSFKGKVDDFNTKGNLATSLGNAILDLNMNFKSKTPAYDGHLATENFDIGTLVKQTSLGKITMNGELKGSGFDFNSVNSKVNATISKIELNQTIYQNLTINGLVANKKFDGIFVSQDPNMALNFDGKLDLSGKDPVYNFNSRFLKVNFQKLGLTKQPIIGSGYVTMNFTGNDIDHFIGSAKLKNLTIDDGTRSYFLEDLLLESHEINGMKSLNLTSSIADAELKGDFTISELSNSFQLYLYHYLPEYINKPKQYKEEAFTFDIKLKAIDSLVAIFAPDFHEVSNISLSGDLNTKAQRFTMDANILQFGYQQFLVRNLFVVGVGDFTSFDLTANGGNVSYNNDVIVPSFQLNSSMANDTAALSITSQSINDILGEASLNCKANASNNQLFVNVLPSSISIKNDKWQLYSNHNIVLGDNIIIRDFIIESGAQKITINTKNNKTEDIIANFQMLDLAGASSLLQMKDILINGRINGDIILADYKNNPTIFTDFSSTNNVLFNKDTIGFVNVSAIYDINNEKLIVNKTTSITQGSSHAKLAGSVNVKDSSINIVAELDRIDITPVEQFIGDYIANLDGIATGKVNIDGNLNDPKVSGIIDIKNVNLKVLFLGTSYRMNFATFKFNNQKIELSDIVLNDERSGNYSGIIKGYISHKNFSDFNLNLSVKSPDLLCLNTRSFENDLFYGYVPAKVNVNINGPIDDLTVDVDAKPLKGSQFHLPINSSGDASTYDYIQFATIGRSQDEEEEKNTKPYYLNLNMNIDATPDAEVFIILDQNTGEEIRAKGNGAIKLNVDLGNSINMFGTYVIAEGKYLFNFRGLIPREFAIDENSKITWSGDALNASLDVKAIYKLPKQLPLYPLISDQYANLDEADKSESKRKYATYISLMLKGSLAQPDFKFDITQPDNKAVGTAAYTKLEQIKNDEKELVSQSGILLILGEFKASDGITNSAYRSGSLSTVSDVVSSALSSEVTNLFQKVTGLKNFSLNLGYQNVNATSDNLNALNTNQFSLNVSGSLLNDRVIIDFGNSLDVGRDANGKTSSNFIGGDFKAQFLISEDGRFRATAYRTNSTNNLELGTQNFTKGGMGLSYRKLFNQFSDLFQSKSKRQPKPILVDSLPKNDS